MADDPSGGVGGLLGSFGTALGGLLGGENPLANLAIGYLSQVGPTTTPTSPFQRFGKAAMYASEAQQNAMQNQLYRAKLAESVREAKAQADLQELIKTHPEMLPGGVSPEFASAVLGAEPGAASKFIPQALTPEAQAQVAAGYPAIAKAQFDLTKEKQLQEIEQVTSNTSIDNALEAERIITRMEKGPVPPGSNAALLASKVADPEGYISASPSTVAQVAATVTGHPMTTAQAQAWLTDWNRLNKLGAKFITDQRNLQSQQTATGGQGRQTDFGLSFIEKQNISPSITGDASRAILSDLIKRNLAIAKIRGWSLDNSGAGEEFIKRQDQRGEPADYSVNSPPATDVAGSPPMGATVPGVAGVSTEPGLADSVLSGAGQAVQGAYDSLNKSFQPASAAAAPPATAPAARKVPTVRYNAAGQATFRSEAEFSRSFKANPAAFLGQVIELDGKLVRVTPAPVQ